MSLELVMLHFATIPFILLTLFILRPGGAEKSYELNYKLVPFLLPGQWKEKDFFVRHTKFRMVFWLLFFTVIYLFGLWKLKSGFTIR